MVDLISVMADKLKMHTEAEQLWLSIYSEYDYTKSEDVIIFWKCNCGEINASVISKGAKKCMNCGVVTLVSWMQEIIESVI